MNTTRSARWIALVVFLAASIPYVPTIDDYFTQDDFGVVQLLASKPWTTFPRWFTMPWMENIWGYTPDELRPFVAFTYQLTALPGADRPEGHHVFNILLHALNALLIVMLARRAVGLTPLAAAAAGVTFAVLPVQAESVAWITGRVDSMPAFFYLATVLAYVQWRRTQVTWWYAGALVVFFVALFSKQNTITMVATLAAYDVLAAPRSDRATWRNAFLAWLPFALMTLGFLVLRRAVFGASLRGGVESLRQVTAAIEVIGRHLLRAVFGHTPPIAAWEHVAVALILLGLVLFVARTRRGAGVVLCFGVAWWAIGAAPVLVAGYESPRHVYLAAAGWAFLVGCSFDGVHAAVRSRHRALRRAVPAACVSIVVALYIVPLVGVVRTWGSWAQVSKLAVDGVAREAAATPEGTLLVVSVPQKSWEWSAPFVLRPPYAPADFSSRVVLVTPMRLHCCGPLLWDAYTRARLRKWKEAGSGDPIVALHFAPGTGAMSRLTDAERPELRALIPALAETDSWQSLDRAVVGLMEQVVRR